MVSACILTPHVGPSDHPQSVRLHVTVIADKDGQLTARHDRVDTSAHAEHRLIHHIWSAITLTHKCIIKKKEIINFRARNLILLKLKYSCYC